MNNLPNALEGIRVLDLSQFTAGPVCTISLAQLGAEVIKVERPVTGEQARPQSGMDMKFAQLHANKKSVTLNMKTAEGKQLLTKLIEKSDVLIENFAPGAIERLGFGFEDIQKINPRCIFCQIKGYSQYSPYANYSAMDGPVQCTGTVASQTGMKDSRPVISNLPLADDPAGRFATIGILAALLQRYQTGKGQAVRINMQEVTVSMSRVSLSPAGVAQKRGTMMAFAGKKAPSNMYRTKPEYEGDENNYISIICHDNKTWGYICEAMNRPDMLEDPRYIDNPTRFDNVVTLDAEIEAWTSQYTKKEAMEILCSHKVVAGAVLGVKDIMESPDMYESGFLNKVQHPDLGEVIIQNSPYHLSDTHVELTPAPALGQHNEDVYKGILGLSDADLAQLKDAHAI